MRAVVRDTHEIRNRVGEWIVGAENVGDIQLIHLCRTEVSNGIGCAESRRCFEDERIATSATCQCVSACASIEEVSPTPCANRIRTGTALDGVGA